VTAEGEPEDYSTLPADKKMLERLRNAAEVIAFTDARIIPLGHGNDALARDRAVKNHLNNLANCQSIEELWSKHTHQMAAYGFDRLLYGFTRYSSTTSIGDPEDFQILTNYPKSYIEAFIGQRHYMHNPMVKWALNHQGVASWSILAETVQKQTLTPAEKRAVALNREMGVTAGYTISFKSVSESSIGAIALSAREGMTQAEVDEIWAKYGHDIHVMNNVAHLKILTLSNVNPGRMLTKRQLEVLQWVGDGKTTQDIALLLGLKSATVEKHLRLARKALAVKTTYLGACAAKTQFVRIAATQ